MSRALFCTFEQFRRNAEWLPELCSLQQIVVASPWLPYATVASQQTLCRRLLQEWEKLWTINKRLIDPVAPRHTAVTAAGRVPLTLSNGPEVEEVEIVPAHKKNPEVGQKASVRSRVRSADLSSSVRTRASVNAAA